MKPERWQRVEELFQAALASAPEFRPSFLDETCAADPALRHEVEQLLVSFDAAGSFLETPAADHLGFVDRPPGFDDLLLEGLSKLGGITALHHFAGSSRAAVIDPASSMGPFSFWDDGGRDTGSMLKGCIAVAEGGAW